MTKRSPQRQLGRGACRRSYLFVCREWAGITSEGGVVKHAVARAVVGGCAAYFNELEPSARLGLLVVLLGHDVFK